MWLSATITLQIKQGTDAMDNRRVCQCCGQSMNPVTVRSKGIYAGWKYGGWLGGGAIISTHCPHCHAENWDDRNRPVQRSPKQKTLLLLGIFLVIATVWGCLDLAVDLVTDARASSFDTVAQWCLIGIGFLMYRRHRMVKRGGPY